MSSFILCAGRQTRWENKHPVKYKQLLPVLGEPVLHRIVRQVRARKRVPIIVTHNADLLIDGVRRLAPVAHRWTVETLASTAELWYGRTTILLGDTAYSKTVMNRIYACEDPIRVFGNEYEIYAISFDDTVRKDVHAALAEARRHARNRNGKGTLRKFYQAYCGLDLDSDAMETKILDRICYIQDYTKDFDMPRDYAQFLNRWERKGLVDDAP